MKILYLFCLVLLLTSCPYERFDFDLPNTETSYSPILMDRSQLEKSVMLTASMPLVDAGKIYTKGKWLYIVEKYKGIHVIDNENPATPINSRFIQIPGCIDLAIKENTLYADNANDLVAIDISNQAAIIITKRIQNAFPDLIPPDDDVLPIRFQAQNRNANSVIVDWIKIK